MATTDLTIRGAGIFGLSVAWAATGKGATVRVIDPHGVAAGASGGVVGALAPHTPEAWNDKKAFQLDSLLMAGDFWAEVDAVSGLSSGYGRLGRLQPLADADAVALATRRQDQARDLWRGAAQWTVIDATEVRGWAPASPTGKLVLDTLSGRLHPTMACQSLASALRLRGVEIVADAPDAGAVLWATGVQGLRDLSADLGRDVGGGVKGQAASLHFDAGAVPQLFIDGLHVIPHANGTVAIGSTSERAYDDPTTTDAQLDVLIDRAMAAVPVLHGARVVTRWAGVRPRARSRAPMLGAWPGRAGHFIANGGFKIGFGMAPKVGHVMADLILDGVDRVPEGFGVSANL